VPFREVAMVRYLADVVVEIGEYAHADATGALR